ncbi:MAG: hypothetical protein WDM90_02905 [Ferruginibacter sp.]
MKLLQAVNWNFTIIVAGKNYKVSITKSQQETEDMVQLIVSITLIIVLVLLLVLFIINRFVLNKLWLPFNNTLSELQQFNLSNKKTMQLGNSSITEFKELNNAVTTMSNQVLKDYDALKVLQKMLHTKYKRHWPLSIPN